MVIVEHLAIKDRDAEEANKHLYPTSWKTICEIYRLEIWEVQPKRMNTRPMQTDFNLTHQDKNISAPFLRHQSRGHSFRKAS